MVSSTITNRIDELRQAVKARKARLPMVTDVQLAQVAGISPIMVSKKLNGFNILSEDEAAAMLNYMDKVEVQLYSGSNTRMMGRFHGYR